MHRKIRQAYKTFSITASLSSVSGRLGGSVLRSGGAVGRFSWVLFPGWLLVAWGPVGLSRFCGLFVTSTGVESLLKLNVWTVD